MLIVGLGEAGCNIAKLFKKHKQYHVELLDEDKGIKKHETVEGYDSIEYKPRKKAIKSASEGLLFVCGSGKISGSKLLALTIPLPRSILTPLWRLPLARRSSNNLIILLAFAPTLSCLFLCLSISSKTLIGIKISLFP